jgi:hypothetical protein
MILKGLLFIILGWSSAIGLVLGIILTGLIPRFADAGKLKSEEDKKLVAYLSNPWLPRRVLTPFGQKVWVVRNYMVAVGLIATVLCFIIGQPK